MRDYILTVLASAKNPLLTLRNARCCIFHPVSTFNINDITACTIHIPSRRTIQSSKSTIKNATLQQSGYISGNTLYNDNDAIITNGMECKLLILMEVPNPLGLPVVGDSTV